MLRMRCNFLPVVLCSVLATTVAGSCYSTDQQPSRRFAKKTPYEMSPGRGNFTAAPDITPGCTPVMLYHLVRHGTRYPRADIMEDMQTHLPYLQKMMNTTRAAICHLDKLAIQNWNFRMNVDDHAELAPEGKRELFNLGSRFGQAFSSMFNSKFDVTKLKFLHTDKKRTIDSAINYVKGLLKGLGIADSSVDALVASISMTEEPLSKGRVLGTNIGCTKYANEVEYRPVEEFEKFKQGPEVAGVRSLVAERLGLDTPVTMSVLNTLWYSCRFETVLYGLNSSIPRGNDSAPWCAVFKDEELKVMEYLYDLESYWTMGYANKLSVDKTCALMQDIVYSVRMATSGKAPTAVLRFGHSSSIQTLRTRLGLYKDKTHLLASNYASHVNRLWRTTLNGPFAANLAFVVYNCSADGFKFRFLSNENDVVIPGCSTSLCDVQKLYDVGGGFADKCDYEEICRHNS